MSKSSAAKHESRPPTNIEVGAGKLVWSEESFKRLGATLFDGKSDFESKAALAVRFFSSAIGEAEWELASLDTIMESLLAKVIPVLGEELSRFAREWEAAPGKATVQDKQKLAAHLNAAVRSWGLVFSHPETNEACNLMAINDKWGGKFAFLHLGSQKRSCSSRSLQGMTPFKLKALSVRTTSFAIQDAPKGNEHSRNEE